MFCPECGAENPNEARFCGGCGLTLETQEVSPPIPDVAETEQTTARFIDGGSSAAEAVSNPLKYGILAISLLIPLIGVVMGLIFLFQEGSEEKKSIGKLWLIVGMCLVLLYAIAGSGEF